MLLFDRNTTGTDRETRESVETSIHNDMEEGASDVDCSAPPKPWFPALVGGYLGSFKWRLWCASLHWLLSRRGLGICLQCDGGSSRRAACHPASRRIEPHLLIPASMSLDLTVSGRMGVMRAGDERSGRSAWRGVNPSPTIQRRRFDLIPDLHWGYCQHRQVVAAHALSMSDDVLDMSHKASHSEHSSA